MFGVQDEANDIVALFRSAFEKSKKKRIVLYGLGINTRAILGKCKDYNFVGVMDAKHEGETFMNMPVFTELEAKVYADIIVIVARNAVLPVIYNRIKHLESTGIEIRNVRGENICQECIPEKEVGIDISKDDLREKIRCHDVISFDIFDTLLVRKVVRPDDIFTIVEERLHKKGIKIFFRENRIRAEAIARSENRGVPNLSEIYSVFSKILDLDGIQVSQIQEEELKTESDFVFPRTGVVEILKYAKQLGKKVYLVSEMYLNSVQMKKLLDKCGIVDYDELLISCECRKNKWPQGELFDELILKCGQNAQILHIGDNEGADIKCAEQKGIHAYWIPSNYELLVSSKLNVLLSQNRTLGDSISIGMFCAKYLSDPFLFVNNKGDIWLRTEEDLGYIAYGALVSGFLCWILKEAEIYDNPFICFMARDGWMLHHIWESMKLKFEDKHFPDADYVLGSRRALAIPSLLDEADLQYALEVTPDSMDKLAMLKYRFGIDVQSIEREWDKEQCVQNNKEMILANAREEFQSYNRYIDGLVEEGRDVLLVDAVSCGTIAKYFWKVTGRKGALLCMIKSSVPDYSVYDEMVSRAFGGIDSKYAPKWSIHKNVAKLESVLTAPQAMFIKFDDNRAVFDEKEEKSQKNKESLNKVQAGVELFSKEIFELIPGIEWGQLTPELCDTFFSLVYDMDVCQATHLSVGLGIHDIFC